MDPEDRWDKELEEGETILAIDFSQTIYVCVLHHHANDIAAKANTGKDKKSFEEMVPEWACNFKDLFDKDNFDELPELKP